MNNGLISKVMKINIFELFIRMWFDVEMNKKRTTLYYDDISVYMYALASQMMRYQKITLDSKECLGDHWKSYFDPEILPRLFFQKELIKMNKVQFDEIARYMPILEANEKYRFLHKSVQEYLAACSI